MAPRALWKGQLRLSLVSIPVELYSATDSGAKVSFRQIHRPTGKGIRYEKVVPGIGPVDAADIVKGYETGDDSYILLEPDEIDAIRLETKRTFELVQFVGACEISPIWYDKPYYLLPSDELAQDAYRVVRDALRAADRVGLGQITLRGKEHLAAVRPCADGLLMETLHYADEIRAAEPMFAQIADTTVDRELLDVATALIERKTAPFDAAAFSDSYAAALRDLIEAKRRNRKTARVGKAEDRPSGENVVDLMTALKDSLKASGTTGGKAAPKAGARRKKAS